MLWGKLEAYNSWAALSHSMGGPEPGLSEHCDSKSEGSFAQSALLHWWKVQLAVSEACLKDHIITFLFWCFKTLLIIHNLSLNLFAFFFPSCKVSFLLKVRLFYQGNDNPYSWVSKHSNIYTLDLVPRIKHIFHFQIQLAIPRLFLYL